MGTEKYGYYWCVKVSPKVSMDGEIYLCAERAEVAPDGSLVFSWAKEDHRQTLLALASGQWLAVYAASFIDGHAVAVEHWPGEMVEK